MEIDRLAPRIAAQQPHLTRTCPQQPEQDANRGGLPCAIRAKKSMRLADADRHVQTVQCLGPAERLLQAPHLDDIRRATTLLRGPRAHQPSPVANSSRVNGRRVRGARWLPTWLPKPTPTCACGLCRISTVSVAGLTC